MKFNETNMKCLKIKRQKSKSEPLCHITLTEHLFKVFSEFGTEIVFMIICCSVIVRSAMHVLSQVDLWQIISPHQLRYVTFTSPACNPPSPPCMSHPGDIEHFIKHTLLGSNVTVLSRSLSIPPWPFSAFNFAGCQAWWCSRMESIQRSRAVQGGEVCIGVMWSAESWRSLIQALK